MYASRSDLLRRLEIKNNEGNRYSEINNNEGNKYKYKTGDYGLVNSVERLIYWLFIASSGGKTRMRIFLFVNDTPANANQISGGLSLDYKTVRHHLKMLEKNNMITKMGSGYNVTYFPSDFASDNEEVVAKIFNKYAPGTVKE